MAAVSAAACLALALGTLTPGTGQAATSTQSVVTASAPEVTGASQQHASLIEAAIERLEADGMWSQDVPQTADAVAISNLATLFGSSVLRAAYSNGMKIGIMELLRGLGYDSNSSIEQMLGDLQSSLESLHADIEQMNVGIEALLHGQDRTDFRASYSSAGKSAARIGSAMNSVRGWIDDDLEPSEANLSDIQTVVTMSISELGFMVNNPTTGVLPLMSAAAEPNGVSDLQHYWAQIDAARDDYRATLGQGLLTLDMMLVWDTTGTIESDLRVTADATVDMTEAMYALGVAPPMPTHEQHAPDGVPYLHARDSPYLLAPDVRNDNQYTDPWKWVRIQQRPGDNPDRAFVRESMGPMLDALRQYRSEHNDGKTLQQTMQGMGIPTKYVFADGFHIYERETGGGLTFYYDYLVRATLVEIKGNEVVTSTADLGVRNRAYRKDWTPGGWIVDKKQKQESDAWAAERIAMWERHAADQSQNWTAMFPEHTTNITVAKLGAEDLTPGGFAADTRPESTLAAAFPDAEEVN